MIVKCTECNASYSVDDGKVKDKKFGFICPKCGVNVIIDNRIKQPIAEDIDLFAEEPAVERSVREAIPRVEESVAAGDAVSSDDFGDFILDETERQPEEKRSRIAALEEEPPAPAEPSAQAGDLDLSDIESLETPAVKSRTPSSEETISLEDFDSAEEILMEAEPAAPKASAKKGDLADIDGLPDLDNLEITEEDFKPLEEDITRQTTETPIEHEETISLEEPVSLRRRERLPDLELSDLEIPEERPAAEKKRTRRDEGLELDESITIDLDSLDIQLEEEPLSEAIPKRPRPGGFEDLEAGLRSDLSDVQVPEEPLEFDASSFENLEAPSRKKQPHAVDENEQDLTLDLDSLDITLDEIEEFKEGEVVDEDERLTIEDAGLTIDELENVRSEIERPASETQPSAEDEDLKLSINEIDPGLSIEDLGREDKSPESLIINEIPVDELPEIDFEKLGAEEPIQESVRPRHEIFEEEPVITPSRAAGVALGTAALAGVAAAASASTREDFLDIETKEEYSRYQKEIEKDYRATEDSVPQGAVNFSIDYSLRYSRAGALLRLLGLFSIALIPHYIILLIYSILSAIVGFFNWIIVMFSGEMMVDFGIIQEKTLRYLLSIGACSTNTIEEMPRFTGSRDIDHSLQMNIIYPARPSRLLAFLRLTGIGITVLAMPHLILLCLLSIGSSIISLIGLFSILATGRWPNILFDFMVRYYRYLAHVLSYLIGLVDHYPSFRFE